MNDDILRRLDRLESRNQILELIAKYCKACDDRDVPLLRSIFTEDATVRSQDGMMDGKGLNAVMEVYRKRFEVLAISVHWTHDNIITFDETDPDRATGECFCHAEAHRNGQTLVGSLRYDDEYRRTDEVWQFSSRTLKFLYYVPVQEYPEALGSKKRMRAYGDQRAADYPETFDCYNDWARHYEGA
ncbi:nuclear transport factor 2 family protein [Palleronia abyssalis]|uniref:Gamma-hexachlorocyclohexane dehydrochlorinase n=1 Tax=Palleronia abyssalis TaxID=1501240 RepID=A0A2R8C0W6_9RHOB|nr:nuclear transport factor 2 family protein [Palleronia abyssalis]SPJ26022.1 Gamma-hexachlorocyclohexane dehydrochlorinase [Palleronia abyssalis]